MLFYFLSLIIRHFAFISYYHLPFFIKKIYIIRKMAGIIIIYSFPYFQGIFTNGSLCFCSLTYPISSYRNVFAIIFIVFLYHLLTYSFIYIYLCLFSLYDFNFAIPLAIFSIYYFYPLLYK